jgi:hypothetical protein
VSRSSTVKRTSESLRNRPAAIEYSGIPGVTDECKQAVMRLIQYGDEITHVRILTNERDHCLLLTVNVGDVIAIKSGFSSGYRGEGPHGFSFVLELLEAHGAKIEEHQVSAELIERVDNSALTERDLESIELSRSVRPTRWHDYIIDERWEGDDYARLWQEFDPIIPFAIVDSRITDLAFRFFQFPDACLVNGYRRLEDIVRKRTGLAHHGGKLFSQAFLGEAPKLFWKGLSVAEQSARGSLFTATYAAYRNPRAHRELGHDSHSQLLEFLLLNHLYVLEKQAVEEAGIF